MENKEPKIVLLVEVSEQQKEGVRELAWRKRSTMSGIVRQALDSFLKAQMKPVRLRPPSNSVRGQNGNC